MTIDMSQFHQAFFEETAEHLASMESLLLALDIDSPSLDDLNAIFRAAHSIKGGAGTFSFNDMTEVTHILETLLDKLRKEELKLCAEMIDVFLQAGDVLKAQLDAHQNGGIVSERSISDVCQKLGVLACNDAQCSQLAVCDIQGFTSSVIAPHRDVQVPWAQDAQERPTAPVEKHYLIQFTPDADTNLDNLFAELSGLGTLDVIESGASQSPPLWRFNLTTIADEIELLDTFAFFAKTEHVSIEQQTRSADEDASYGFFTDIEEIKTQPESDPGYGFFEPVALPTPASEPLEKPPGAITASPAKPTRQPEKAASNSSADSSIRVSIDKVDQLINLVGELVITQAMLTQTASEVDPTLCENLMHGMAQLERNTRDLQESVMSIRMMPISFVFSRFPRVVRDMAAKLNKQIELKTVGEGTEMDKGLIERLCDPLTHLVRNSLDHGIESPENRIAAGKDPKGTITLRAFHQGGNIIIEVSDDGAGLHRDKILAKARERGMAVNDDISDQEVWQLIFEAGFSTAEVVTDVSGRGVGMDVVKRNILSMGGRVEINSAPGMGTRISIRLPLTLAILDGMSVGVGKEIFIIPLTFIVESLQPRKEDVKTIHGKGDVVQVRGEYLPVLPLHTVFNIKPNVTEVEHGIMVILEAEGSKTALFVDELIGQHQVVIKSMETNYRKIQGISGATIMGSGKVALILDVDTLVGMSGDDIAVQKQPKPQFNNLTGAQI